MREKESGEAWAVRGTWPLGPYDPPGTKKDTFLCGRYWFGDGHPPYAEGCRVALFKSRAEARKAIQDRTCKYAKAVPVKVRVTVEEKP